MHWQIRARTQQPILNSVVTSAQCLTDSPCNFRPLAWLTQSRIRWDITTTNLYQFRTVVPGIGSQYVVRGCNASCSHVLQPIQQDAPILLAELFHGNIKQRLSGTYIFQYNATFSGMVIVNGEVVLDEVPGPSVRNFSFTFEAEKLVRVQISMDVLDSREAEFSQSLLWKPENSDLYA